MRRMVACLLLLVLLLCSCSDRGNVNFAVTAQVDSALYSEREIEDAIEVAEEYFKRHFDGCMLTAISYAGDERTTDWADRYDGSEVIVLISDFLTGPEAGDGSLNPNDIYTKWMWILVRTPGGRWRHADHGY